MTLRVFWADSRGKVTIVLLFLWIAALIRDFQLSYLLFPMAAVAGSYAIDALLGRLRLGTWFFSLSSLITGLLIGMIVTSTSPAVLWTAVILASLSKYVLKLEKTKHIFNPAAFGIMTSSTIFNQPVAWWAATLGIVPMVIVGIGMMLPLLQLRKFWIPIGFLVTYGLGLAVQSGIASGLALTFDGTVFLFAWVMVTEPITSPSRGLWRYGWGVLVASLAVGFTLIGVSWSDPLLTALLLANGIGFISTRRL